MSCKLQTKAVNKLKEDGVLSDKMEILDLKNFDRLNELYTDTAINKYGLISDRNLFEISKREIKLPFNSSYSRDNIKTVYRAVPNEDLFEELELLVDKGETTSTDSYTTYESRLIEQNGNKTGSEEDYNYLYNKPSSVAKDSIGELNSQEDLNSNLGKIRDELFGGNLTNTTSNQILRNALANLDLNETTRTLVKSLLTSRAKVKFTQNLGSDTVGQYDSLTRTIQLDRNRLGFLNEYATFELILHEIMHDFTVSSIENPKNDSQRQFRDEMTELYEYYKTRSDSQDSHYGFTNVHEFISEVISNPVFRNHIDSLSLNNKGSMLNQIWEFIKRLVGISGTKNSTEIVESVMEFVQTKEDLNSPLKTNFVLQKKVETPKYSEKFTKELTSMDAILKKVLSDIDSVSSKSAAVRGKDDENSKRFENVRDLIVEFADKSANEAIYKFIQFADSELNKLNHSLKIRLNKGTVNSDYLYRSKAYLAIYNSLDDIKNVLENQFTNNLIEKTEYERLLTELTSAKQSYESFNNKHLNESKEILTQRLAPFNTRPIDKRRQELEREYKNINPGKVDKSVRRKWINDKLDLEIDALTLQQNEEVRKLMDTIPLDLQNMETMLTSEKNMNNLLLKLFSFTIDKEELAIRQHALSIRKRSFDALKAYDPKGANNSEKYKKILTQDGNGNHYFASKYNPKFMTERKALSEARDAAFDEYGKQSKEYKAAQAKLQKWTTDNTITDEDGFNIRPTDKWLDKNYKALSGKDLEYHTFVTDQIKESDIKTQGHKSLIINYMGAEFIKLPSIRKSDLDRMMSGDLAGIAKDKIADFYKPTQDTTTMGELEEVEKPSSDEFVKALTTVNNEERFLVPIHFRNRISPNTQSLDIPTLVLMNSVMSEEFRGKHSLEAESQLLLDIVGQANVLKTQSVSRKFMVSAFSRDMSNPDHIRIKGIDSNLYKKLKNVIENRVYNILDASNNKVSKDNLTVIAKSLMGYTAHLNLAVNYLSAIPNVFQGKFQNFIEGVGGSTYSSKDVAWAEAKYWNEMTANGGLNDIGSPINSNKLNLVIDYLDVMTEFSMKKHDFEKNNKFKALFNSGSLHAFNSIGEHYIQGTLLLSVFSSIKAMDSNGNYVDINGNTTTDEKAGMNLYEAIVIKDGMVTFHPKVTTSSFNPDQKLSENGLVQIQNLVRKKVIDLHGQYDSKIQATLQRYWYGKAITMFRKYLLPGFYKRYRGMVHTKIASDKLNDNQEYYSLETRQFEEGIYTTAVRFFRNSILAGIKEMKLEIMTSDWNNLTDYEKGNIHKTIRELALTGLMLVSSMLIAGAAKDEDDEELRSFLFTMAYVFRRQESELMQYYSPTDTLKIFRTPFVALSTLEKTANLFSQVLPWNISEEYKTGDRKGKYKAWIKTKKLIPVISQSERSAETSFNYLQNLLDY
ncbi:RNA polymerase accociated protein [Cellulophaga phage phi14:2]|uniref:Structural protein n=1 Tax=Cellulophaga phage phi14:2 TaxID=1327990 RepID=S0A048_9CAUD|nr:RNA polymerase accociated protein [Cellulophaga phage phi14:2]AGO48954.1 structural protein [Cellulophaga phage phi14:2]